MLQHKIRQIDEQGNVQFDFQKQKSSASQIFGVSSSTEVDLKELYKLKRYKSFSNQKSLHQNNDERFNSPQKQGIQILIRQNNPLQQVSSAQLERAQQFYSKKRSMDEYHTMTIDRTQSIDKKYKVDNTINYPYEINTSRYTNITANNSPVKIDKLHLKQEMDLPKLKTEIQNSHEQQQKSPLSKRCQRQDNQQDLGFKFIRDRNKNASLIESNTKSQIKKSQNSSRHVSPSIQDFSNIKYHKIHLQQATDRIHNSNNKDPAKYSLNSSLLLNQPQSKMIGLSSVIQGLTSKINQNEMQKQQSYMQLQLSTNRTSRQSMSQLRSQKKIESPEKINDNSQIEKSDYDTTPFNYNFTLKRKSKQGTIHFLGKLDSNMFPIKQNFKINLQQEEQKSVNDFSPKRNYNDRSESTSPIFRIRKRLNTQEEQTSFSSSIQQNFFSNIQKVQIDQDVTPQSLNEFENDSPLLKKDKKIDEVSSSELIAAYNFDDRKAQRQILLREQIQKIAEKTIPRFIKLCIDKNPDCFELMKICNPNMPIEKFCDKIGKLVTYCLNSESVKITSFNQIKMSLSLCEQLLIYIHQFFLQNNLNQQFFEEFCETFRNMQLQLSSNSISLFQELGGKRKIELIIEGILRKLDKSFDLELQSKVNTIVNFGCNLLSGDVQAVDENIKQFKEYMNTFGGVFDKTMYTSQFFFIVKYQIFQEIVVERDIPWRVKMLIINSFEKLRYKYFGDLHGLGDSLSFIDLASKIQQNLNEQHWNRIGFIQKNLNNQKSFFMDLLRIILDGENTPQLKKFLESNQVNINFETVPIIESLVKGVLIKEKVLPLLTKQDLDLKFQKLKKYLGFESSQSYLIKNIDKLHLEMQKWIQQNNKINKLDDETSKKYEDLDYFFLLLSSVFEDICPYHLADSVCAQDFFKFDHKLIQYQLKAFQRVLISTYMSSGSQEPTKLFSDIDLLSSYMMKYFNYFRQF